MTTASRFAKAARHPGLVVDKLWLFLLSPRTALLDLWRRFPYGSFERRMEWDLIQRPPYAFGIYHAADLAKRLGLPRMSAIEFGVAGGRGLLSMERIAAEVEAIFGVGIDIYGFDTGGGLPPPKDYRDLPYVWEAAEYRMDEAALRARLSRARLLIGDVADTVGSFIAERAPAPIGFVSFDLDYYSSTVAALKLLDGAHGSFLPRVLCYFDDTLGTNRHVGELLAIEEFNAAHERAKIAPLHGLELTRRIPGFWNAGMRMLHLFDHPRYGDHVGDVPHFAG
jgi:hypothetical protein